MGMKLNLASPYNGLNTSIEINSSAERVLYGYSLGDTIDGSIINPAYAGDKFNLTGGSDKQGFPMDISLNTDKRQRKLRKKGELGFKPIKKGEKRRKSVRGAIVSEETSVLCLKVVNPADQIDKIRKIAEGAEEADGNDTTALQPIKGLTDAAKGGSHWPKRITKLRRALQLDENVTEEEIKSKI